MPEATLLMNRALCYLVLVITDSTVGLNVSVICKHLNNLVLCGKGFSTREMLESMNEERERSGIERFCGYWLISIFLLN